MEDRTEGKSAQFKLARSEYMLSRSQQLSRTGTWIYDLGKKDHHWSVELSKVLNSDTFPENPIDFLRDILHCPETIIDDFMAEGDPGQFKEIGFDSCITSSASASVYLQHLVKLLYDGQGKLERLFGNTQDVTDKRLTQERLRVSEQQLELAVDGGDLGLWFWDVSARKMDLDPEWWKRFGYDFEGSSMTAEMWNRICHQDDLLQVNQQWDNYVCGKFAFYECDYRIRDTSDKWHWIHDRGRIVERDKTGAPIRLAGIHQDITNRKRAESALLKVREELEDKVTVRTRELKAANQTLQKEISVRQQAEAVLLESEQNYRLLVENQLDLLVKMDQAGRFLFVSPSYCDMFGKSSEELLGKSFLPFIHPDDRESTRLAMGKLNKPPHIATMEQRAMTCNGWRWLHWTDKAIVDDNGDISSIIGVGRDVTKRKLVEAELDRYQRQLETEVEKRTAALAAANRKLQNEIAERERTDATLRKSTFQQELLFRDGELGLWEIDVNSNKFLILPQLVRQLGFDPQLLRGTIDDLAKIIHPDDLQEVVQTLEESITKGIETFEQEWRALNSQGEVLWFLSRGLVVEWNDDGSPKHIIGSHVNITNLKLATQEASLHQEQLIQADKMASLGILVTGVAHEINNPNSFIRMGAENLAAMLADALPKLDSCFRDTPEFILGGLPYQQARSDILRILDGLVSGSDRIAKIVANLREFARPTSTSLDELVDVNVSVNSATELLGSLIRKSTKHFTSRLATDLPFIKGNGHLLQGVIINLLTNACQALISSDQSIEISTRFKLSEGQVEICVTDTGAGISEENLKHVFDPFFTTKRDSGGVGIGLSLCHKIVENHDGTIEFTSTEGEKTAALVSLPLPRD